MLLCESETHGLTIKMYRTYEGSRKGSTVYEHQMLEYRKNKSNNADGVLYLRCTTKSCPGKANIRGDTFVVTQSHNHSALEESHFRVKEAKTSLKRAAEQSAAALKDLFDDVTRDMNVGGELNYKTMESTMRKRRRKTFPTIPQTPREAAERLTHPGMESLPYTANFV